MKFSASQLAFGCLLFVSSHVVDAKLYSPDAVEAAPADFLEVVGEKPRRRLLRECESDCNKDDDVSCHEAQ